jgi:SAM-dependent methyltransferase
MNLQSIYSRRFLADLSFRNEMWRVLCRSFFQRYVPDASVVLELGAGMCGFINNIRAGQKIAIDINPDVRNHADHDVRVIVGRTTGMNEIPSGSVDVAFASNVFEHLERQETLDTIREVRRVLVEKGKFMVLQPNIRFCSKDYWMFFDHITPIDDRALAEALETNGFRLQERIPRFLPYTSVGRLPKSAFLVRAYLCLRPAWFLFGQQSFILCNKV